MAEFIFNFLPVLALAMLILTWIVFSLYPDKSKKSGSENFILMILLAAIISTVISVYITAEPGKDINTAAKYGQMGDYFGGMLNPILAFASFIALLYTIRIQSDAQNKATQNSVNDRKLSYLIPEYNRLIGHFSNALDELDELYKTNISAGMDYKITSLEGIFHAARIRIGNETNGYVLVNDLVSGLTSCEFERSGYDHDTRRYVTKVQEFKIEVKELYRLHAEILESTGCTTLGHLHFRKAAKHLIVATVFCKLPQFSYTPVLLSNLPKGFVMILNEMLEELRLDVSSFNITNIC